MYLVEMPLPHDSLNQMLEITEFLAAEHMKLKETSVVIFSNLSPTPYLVILFLWVVVCWDSDTEGNDYLIHFEIVIF